MYNTGNLYGGALHIAKSLSFLSCRHPGKHVSEIDCITALVGKSNIDRLVCGLNDKIIRCDIRALGHTPVLFIRDNIILIEPPSERSKSQLQHSTLEQLNQIRNDEKPILQHVKQEDDNSTTFKPKPVKKAAKGPNPLSVRKKKVHVTKEQRLASKQQQQHTDADLQSQHVPLDNTNHNDNNSSAPSTVDVTIESDQLVDNIILGKRKRQRVRHRSNKKLNHQDTRNNNKTSQQDTTANTAVVDVTS